MSFLTAISSKAASRMPISIILGTVELPLSCFITPTISNPMLKKVSSRFTLLALQNMSMEKSTGNPASWTEDRPNRLTARPAHCPDLITLAVQTRTYPGPPLLWIGCLCCARIGHIYVLWTVLSGHHGRQHNFQWRRCPQSTDERLTRDRSALSSLSSVPRTVTAQSVSIKASDYSSGALWVRRRWEHCTRQLMDLDRCVSGSDGQAELIPEKWH